MENNITIGIRKNKSILKPVSDIPVPMTTNVPVVSTTRTTCDATDTSNSSPVAEKDSSFDVRIHPNALACTQVVPHQRTKNCEGSSAIILGFRYEDEGKSFLHTTAWAEDPELLTWTNRWIRRAGTAGNSRCCLCARKIKQPLTHSNINSSRSTLSSKGSFELGAGINEKIEHDESKEEELKTTTKLNPNLLTQERSRSLDPNEIIRQCVDYFHSPLAYFPHCEDALPDQSHFPKDWFPARETRWRFHSTAMDRPVLRRILGLQQNNKVNNQSPSSESRSSCYADLYGTWDMEIEKIEPNKLTKFNKGGWWSKGFYYTCLQMNSRRFVRTVLRLIGGTTDDTEENSSNSKTKFPSNQRRVLNAKGFWMAPSRNAWMFHNFRRFMGDNRTNMDGHVSSTSEEDKAKNSERPLEYYEAWDPMCYYEVRLPQFQDSSSTSTTTRYPPPGYPFLMQGPFDRNLITTRLITWDHAIKRRDPAAEKSRVYS